MSILQILKTQLDMALITPLQVALLWGRGGLELYYIQRCCPASDSVCFCDSGNIVPSPRSRTEYSSDRGKPWKPGYCKHKLSVTSIDTSHRSTTVRTIPENNGKVCNMGHCELV